VTSGDIALLRLVNQQIAASQCKEPAEVVASLGAMQAQDYLGTLWAIGLRLPTATEAEIERAIADRTIIRTWPLRSTLHFVAAADAHWLLGFLGPRIVAAAALRHKQYGLDETVLTRIRKVLVKALQGNQQLTRHEIYAWLKGARISVEGQRGYHILWRMGVDRVICFGPRRGRQQTFSLLEEWAPQARKLEKDAALAELTLRYFKGHGPATLQDFVWWSGLKISDAKAGLAMVSAQLESLTVDDQLYWMHPGMPRLGKRTPIVNLLPGFDEYLLGYRDRTAALDPGYAQKIQPGSNGMFSSTIVVNGRVAGTWRRVLAKKSVKIGTSLFRSLTNGESRVLEEAIRRYCAFLGVERGPG
jgi:hypothetical protein